MPITPEMVGTVVTLALDRNVEIDTDDGELFTIVPDGFQAVVHVGHAGRVWIERNAVRDRQSLVDGYVLQAVVALLHTGGSDQEQVTAFREDFANVLADAEAKADRDMAI